MKQTVSAKIKELRIENKLSQAELGEKLSVSQDTVSLWENGKSLPSIEIIVTLCKLFSVSADYILGLSDY